jgi:hypothetical protein
MIRVTKKTSYAILVVFAIALGLAGCGNPTSAPTAKTTKTYVYAVDSTSGKVFQIDPATSAVASTPLVTVGQNSSGEIRFGAGKAFVAVARYNNTAPGVYCFDPSSSSPAAAMVGSSTYSAQYICIVSDTLGYVSVADYDSTERANNGIYSFNPSSPSSGLTVVYKAATIYPQDLVLGSDGCLYVANGATNVGESSDGVIRLDLSGATPAITQITLTGSGPTGLLAGTYDGKTGVFVAETGPYDSSFNALNGTIDFIPSGLGSGLPATKVISLPASRLAAFNASTLVVTGGYPSHTNIIALNGASATPHEAYYSTSGTFGSSDIDVYNGYAYIAGGFGSNSVYKVSPEGAVSVLTVGSSTDSITNVGIGTTEE